MLPTSVEIVTGDVGDPSSLKTAVEGCNKIIFCATARSSITGDLNRVDNEGVYNIAKAFQVSSPSTDSLSTMKNFSEFPCMCACFNKMLM